MPESHTVAHNHFDVLTAGRQHPLHAWRERVGHVIDVLPAQSDLDKPFRASIDRYEVGRLKFTDCSSDAVSLDRSLARISTDTQRDFAFHVFLKGGMERMGLRATTLDHSAANASIVAIDLGQPIRMRRGAARVLTFFVPRAQVEQIFPDAETLHGRSIAAATPLTQLIVQHAQGLSQNVAGMSIATAGAALHGSAELLLSAFGKQTGLSGTARAAARAAMFGQIKRYIRANLHQADLTPEHVLEATQLPRPTVYRMFQHEGGLAAYIRDLRLRLAAEEMLRYPHLAVMDIAYGFGFKSPSDFSRAFRRTYDMAPQDLRALTKRVA